MRKLRLAAAVLLALPLILFGGNYFVHVFSLPEAGEHPGEQLLQAIRDGGLMSWIALSHVIVGAMLLLPRLCFAGAPLQLPISLGILAFHLSMHHVILADPERLRMLTSAPSS